MEKWIAMYLIICFLIGFLICLYILYSFLKEASAVIIGIFLLTEVSKEEQIKYLIMIWLSCLSLIFAYWANKNKH